MIRSERSLTLATASCNTVSLSAFLSLASHVLATWFVCRLTEYLPYEDPLRNCAHIYRAGNLITKKLFLRHVIQYYYSADINCECNIFSYQCHALGVLAMVIANSVTVDAWD